MGKKYLVRCSRRARFAFGILRRTLVRAHELILNPHEQHIQPWDTSMTAMTSPLKRKRDGAIYIEDEVTGFIRNKKRRNRAGIQKGSRSRVLQEPESSGGVIEVPREHATSSQLDCKASVEILAQKSGDNLEHSTQTAIEKVKKRRRTKSGAHDNNETGSKAGEDDETKSKDEKYKSRKKSHKKPHHAAAESRWNITQALGGRLINADPIVTNDGQYVLQC